MKVTGRCHCGEITYEAEVDPAAVELCHCNDCQRLSGSAFRVVVPVVAGRMRILTGAPRNYVKIADSGNRRAQSFCPNCGSPIYSKSADREDGFFGLRVGTIDQRDALVPKRQFWLQSAREWVGRIGDLPGEQTE